MSKKADIEEKAWSILKNMTEDSDISPVDVEYVKKGDDYSLLVYIDKETGVTINDCEEVSRRFEQLLDETDFINDAYVLEVSSPGLGRTIRRPRDFEFACGKEVEVSLYKAIDGEKSFIGILTAFDKNTVTIKSDEEMVFNRKDIAIIKLTFEI